MANTQVSNSERKITKLDVICFSQWGYSKNEIEDGYNLFESGYIPGAMRFEKIDDIPLYDSDEAAMKAATRKNGWDFLKIEGIPEIFPKIPQNIKALSGFKKNATPILVS